MPAIRIPLTAYRGRTQHLAVTLEVLEVVPFSIAVEWAIGNFQVAGTDLLDSLTKVRLRMEAHGFLLACQGARSNVHPSGMTRGMTNGRMAYRLERGQRPTDEHLVDVFAPAAFGEVGTVAAQRDFFEAFFEFRPREWPESAGHA